METLLVFGPQKLTWVQSGKTIRASTGGYSAGITPNPHFGEDAQEVWVNLEGEPFFSCAVVGESTAKIVVEHVINSVVCEGRVGQLQATLEHVEEHRKNAEKRVKELEAAIREHEASAEGAHIVGAEDNALWGVLEEE